MPKRKLHIVANDDYTFSIAWDDGAGAPGLHLGESFDARKKEPDWNTDPGGWELWTADRKAYCLGTKRHYKLKHFYWATKGNARSTLSEIKAALKAGPGKFDTAGPTAWKQPPWAEEAIAQGWKPPRAKRRKA